MIFVKRSPHLKNRWGDRFTDKNLEDISIFSTNID